MHDASFRPEAVHLKSLSVNVEKHLRLESIELHMHYLCKIMKKVQKRKKKSMTTQRNINLNNAECLYYPLSLKVNFPKLQVSIVKKYKLNHSDIFKNALVKDIDYPHKFFAILR